ncbi:MAG: nickel pincer cofactor biosynthesis protein LarC [Oscillospiraceae bacterium]|jgi:uncharacterized protein (TIGR00299 family) protein|nr:nickel pincer cofactor biosynthesis protein LarC [Oscillospiraceae bacterium]
MTLYLELNMGAAGDMLMAALVELLPEPDAFTAKMAALNLPGVVITRERSVKMGIVGTHMRVVARGEEETSEDVNIKAPVNVIAPHTHADGTTHTHGDDGASRSLTYNDIVHTIEHLPLPPKVVADALAVYKLLGDAESAVHGAPPEQIHFHEVGTLDALADIVGVCVLVDMLGVTDIAASPVHVGSGFVRCAHGIVPVPAPATAQLLTGIPIYSGKIRGELCTPTGAALLRHFVTRFGDMPPTVVRKIGYGMGSKDFDALNAVRAYLCDGDDEDSPRDAIVSLTCNLDDMTPEAIGAAVDLLLKAGAVDVFTTPIHMKKNRLATMLTALCRAEDEPRLTRLILKHTTTLGVRASRHERAVLHREIVTVETQFGAIRVKVSRGYGVERAKPEYDDVAASSAAHGVTFSEVYDAARRAYASI